MRRDPALAGVIRAAGPCTMRRRGDPYRYLVRSILYQQLAGAAAAAIERRFRDAFGGRVPAPEVLHATAPERLRPLGLSRQKAAAVCAVAGAFARGEVRARQLPHLDDAAVVEQLTRIRGVGVWTAQMVLMNALGRPDVLPTGDHGVRKGARALFRLDELPKPAELEALAEPWRPYRSVASWYLWRATEMVLPE